MARILNTSNIRSTYFGGGRIYSVVCDEDLENGMIGTVGKLVTGEKELRRFEKVTDITSPNELVIISNPEVLYDESPSKRRLESYFIPANTPARAYSLALGDEFDVSIDAIEALNDVPVVGNYVVLKNGELVFVEKASLDDTEKFVARVEDIYHMNRPIQVTKNTTNIINKMVRLKIVKYVEQ